MLSEKTVVGQILFVQYCLDMKDSAQHD